MKLQILTRSTSVRSTLPAQFPHLTRRFSAPVIATCVASLALGLWVPAQAGPNDSAWMPLFRPNDTTLSDWQIKIQHQNLGVNTNNTFKWVAKGTDNKEPRLQVIQENPASGTYGYGHMFYKTPFSYYIIRSQYHFQSKTTAFASAGTWTIQNNGLMLHCQSPSSMGKDQDYPASIEGQLLGYWSTAAVSPPNSRSMNVCVPGVTIKVNNKWYSDGSGHHCTSAKMHSLNYVMNFDADTWQYAQTKVLGDSDVTFWVKSKPDTAWDSVMHFTEVHSGSAPNESNLASNSQPLKSGYIAIQAEGTSTEFATIELLNLMGCTNPNDTAYKSYFVKSDPAACSGVVGLSPRAQKMAAENLFTFSGNRIIAGAGILDVTLFDWRGARVAAFNGGSQRHLDITGIRPGIYTVRVSTVAGVAQGAHSFL